MEIICFLSFVKNFVVQWFIHSNQRSNWLFSTVSYDFEFVCFKENWTVFQICHYFLFFFLTSGVTLVKTGRNPYPMSHKLMSVTVLFLTNGFLVFILRVFVFLYIYKNNCVFSGSFCSLVNIQPHWKIQFKESRIRKMHILKNGISEFDNLFLLNILCFWTQSRFSCKI